MRAGDVLDFVSGSVIEGDVRACKEILPISPGIERINRVFFDPKGVFAVKFPIVVLTQEEVIVRIEIILAEGQVFPTVSETAIPEAAYKTNKKLKNFLNIKNSFPLISNK